MGFEDGIWASRLGFGPQGWDLGLEVGIWASRLGFGPRGWALGLRAWGGVMEKEEEEEEEEKFPLCESIGHWPLRGRCPKRK